MDESTQSGEQQIEPYANVPPQLIYEAAFTARNAEVSILDGNTRYFYLTQVALIGYMVFKFENYIQGETNGFILILLLAASSFALSFHAVYTEVRLNGSFNLIRRSEDTCQYFEEHGYIDPVLYYYARVDVREHGEIREFSGLQMSVLVGVANFWLAVGFIFLAVFISIVLFQLTT
jgi:hypothetical protein